MAPILGGQAHSPAEVVLRHHLVPLDAKQRASLPDSAFAYIDSRGRRRLPINDAAHVRNALARFNQVVFEDEAARDKARTRLLRAASKYGVVPIGFVSAQLQPQRKLPKGHVTFLLTDVERSTELLSRLEDRYAPLLSAVRRAMRDAVRKSGGREVDARADDLFAVFEQPPAALEAALAIQRAMRAGPWTGRRRCARADRGAQWPADADRDGLRRSCRCTRQHASVTRRTAGRSCSSSAVQSAVLDSLAEGRGGLRSLGTWRFQGLRDHEEIFQVEAKDLPAKFPPLRSAEPVTARP